MPFIYSILFAQVDKSITAMYKKLQKNLTSEELLPSLWDKCKVFFFLTVIQFIVTNYYNRKSVICRFDFLLRKDVETQVKQVNLREVMGFTNNLIFITAKYRVN